MWKTSAQNRDKTPQTIQPLPEQRRTVKQERAIEVTSSDSSNSAGGISIHAVDIARGIPANGLHVRLWRIDETRTQVASGTCTDTGLLQHPVAQGEGVERGMYEVEFDVASYYRNSGMAVPDPAFLETAIFRFGIDKVSEHFHLPFKFTPWGFSLFRGGQ